MIFKQFDVRLSYHFGAGERGPVGRGRAYHCGACEVERDAGEGGRLRQPMLGAGERGPALPRGCAYTGAERVKGRGRQDSRGRLEQHVLGVGETGPTAVAGARVGPTGLECVTERGRHGSGFLEIQVDLQLVMCFFSDSG